MNGNRGTLESARLPRPRLPAPLDGRYVDPVPPSVVGDGFTTDMRHASGLLGDRTG